jgi:hypothetical protein
MGLENKTMNRAGNDAWRKRPVRIRCAALRIAIEANPDDSPNNNSSISVNPGKAPQELRNRRSQRKQKRNDGNAQIGAFPHFRREFLPTITSWTLHVHLATK